MADRLRRTNLSHLKRDWHWRRTRLTSHTGARTWCGLGVFAHNLIKITQLQT
jgi:IS5 family transposase